MDTTADQNTAATELRLRDRRAASTLAGLGTAQAAAAPKEEVPQGCTTRSRAAAAAKQAAKRRRTHAERPLPDRLVFQCHRAGKPNPNGKRRSKLCQCPFRVEITRIRDEDGHVVEIEYKEIGSHFGHIPGSKEDRQWLPNEWFNGDDNERPMTVDGGESCPSGEEDGAAGGSGA